jgi:diadenosine tetraphosphate (Ap4A) HIT family hydrolase
VKCQSCQAGAGAIVLTDAPRLDLDEYWYVEHCHPVAVAGWLVLVLRRHARALHELTDDEAVALGRWLPALTRALHTATGCELEYVMQFAEGEGFQHVHVHLVARAHDWPAEFKGPRVFSAWNVADAVSSEETMRVIRAVGAHLGIEPTQVG